MNELIIAYEELVALLVCEMANPGSSHGRLVEAREVVDEIKGRMLDDHK